MVADLAAADFVVAADLVAADVAACREARSSHLMPSAGYYGSWFVALIGAAT